MTEQTNGMSETYRVTLHLSSQTHLRCCGYIAPWQSDVWSPCDIAHPVSVSLECLLLNPCLGVIAERPDLDEVITASAGEAFKRCRSRRPRLMWMDERAGVGGGRPGDSIATDSVAVKDISDPLTVI